jgi:hypothetical protein
VKFRILLIPLFIIGLVASLPGLSYGQENRETTESSLTKDQVKELKNWMKKDSDYLKWYGVWGNRAIVKRRLRPDPPVWLKEKCDGLQLSELLINACHVLKQRDEDSEVARIRATIALERQGKEKPTNTKFYQRVHFGGGWPLVIMNIDGLKYGGLFETHVSIINAGKVEVNLPGLIILSMPNSRGGREIKIAPDITLGVRLTDFHVPGMRQQFVLHFNISNAWENLGTPGFENRLSLADLSITVK